MDTNRAYAQVIEESDTLSGLTRMYLHGDDLISQGRVSGGNASTAVFDTYYYDGLGSVRGLTDTTGSVSDSYTYQVFGNLEAQNGTTDNRYLFTGEQFDPNVGFYYLRARYYNPSIGRFQTMDTYAGRIHEPQTLHKYLYTHADPVNNIDPSGQKSLTGLNAATNIQASLANLAARGAFLLRAYNTAEAVKGFFDLMGVVRQVMGVAFDDVPKIATQDSLGKRGFGEIDLSEAAQSAAINFPKAIGSGIGDWARGFSSRLSTHGRNALHAMLIYMPIFVEGQLGATSVKTPAKVTFGNRNIPVRLIFGANNPSARGQLFGIGMQIPRSKRRQLVRMDYHKWHPVHNFKKELTVFRDGNFHYHVNKWNQ